MGTVREQILLASSLSSGTIREHLANPNTGVGDGALEVILQESDLIVLSEAELHDVEMVDPVIEATLDQADYTVELDSPEIEVELE